MDFTKEALQYIVNMGKPVLVDVNGHKFSDRVMKPVYKSFTPEPLIVLTLTGLVDYIHSGMDFLDASTLLHVVNSTEVHLISGLDDEERRKTLVIARAEPPIFQYDKFLDQERFLIGIQSVFADTEDRKKLLHIAGTGESGTLAQYSDDGVTQRLTVRKGLVARENEVIPNCFTLKPYRTFLEIDQPESRFLFRIWDDGGLNCAIFEADGGAWKNKAILAIREYLESKIEADERVIVIA